MKKQRFALRSNRVIRYNDINELPRKLKKAEEKRLHKLHHAEHLYEECMDDLRAIASGSYQAYMPWDSFTSTADNMEKAVRKLVRTFAQEPIEEDHPTTAYLDKLDTLREQKAAAEEQAAQQREAGEIPVEANDPAEEGSEDKTVVWVASLYPGQKMRRLTEDEATVMLRRLEEKEAREAQEDEEEEAPSSLAAVKSFSSFRNSLL